MGWDYAYRKPLATAKVTCDSASRSLATLGFTIPKGTNRLTVQNLDSTNSIEINDGTVVTGSAYYLAGYAEKVFSWQTSELRGLEFLSGSGADMFILCEGPG